MWVSLDMHAAFGALFMKAARQMVQAFVRLLR
jgi:hypothetical protein